MLAWCKRNERGERKLGSRSMLLSPSFSHSFQDSPHCDTIRPHISCATHTFHPAYTRTGSGGSYTRTFNGVASRFFSDIYFRRWLYVHGTDLVPHFALSVQCDAALLWPRCRSEERLWPSQMRVACVRNVFGSSLVSDLGYFTSDCRWIFQSL